MIHVNNFTEGNGRARARATRESVRSARLSLLWRRSMVTLPKRDILVNKAHFPGEAPVGR